MSFIKSPRWSSCRAGALIEGKQQNGRLVASPSPRADGPGDIRQNKLLESLAGSKLRIIHSANNNLVSRNRAATLMRDADANSTSASRAHVRVYRTYMPGTHVRVDVRYVRRRCSYIAIIATVIIIIPPVCAGAIRHGQFS